jgi:hypothetical protein
MASGPSDLPSKERRDAGNKLSRTLHKIRTSKMIAKDHTCQMYQTRVN